MRTLQHGFALLALVAIALVAANSQAVAKDQITPDEALKYVGAVETVCGIVASARYASSSRGSPTFLNLGRPYLNQVFTAVIWGENRSKFSPPPEKAYANRRICVSGKISKYRGAAEIIVSDPSQIARR